MMLIYMIRVLFVLFFVYTVIYLFQMGISLCISIYRLEKYKKNKTLNRKLFPTAFAKRIPVSVIIPAYNEAACITETIEALFEEDEDNFAGKLSDERYSRMAAKYEKEQAELLQSVSMKEKELAELEQESVDIRLLLAGLREYSSMETLTPEVVNKIIKQIEVHNSEMLNGHKLVGVDIYFTGVGLVDLATIKEMLAIAESSRS